MINLINPSKPAIRLSVLFFLGVVSLSLYIYGRSWLSEPAFELDLPEVSVPIIPATGEVQIGIYDTLELVFTASVSPGNPFDTYLLKVEITDPAGKKFVIDGFFDGNGRGGQDGRIWKARITPYAAGKWTWRTVPGDQADPQLLDISGEFDAVANQNTGGVVQEGKYFRFQNGGIVYLVGNFLDLADNLRTTHTFMSETTTDAQRDAILKRQRDFHNVNKANIYFANWRDYDEQSVTPWVGDARKNDKTKMDLSRWRSYDRYILLFKQNRIMAEMWFFADDSRFGEVSEVDKQRLGRYAMARTSAFSHTLYVIALEWQEDWTHAEVVRFGNFLQQYNPWDRLLSVHSITSSEWEFSGEPWATFIASQAGNGAAPKRVNKYAIDVINPEDLPHISEEFGYLNSDSDPEMRAKLWANFTSGAAGSGTGSDLKAFNRFLAESRVPFQRMQPANELVADGGESRFVLAEPGHHYVVYSSSGSFNLNVSGQNLVGRWFNPRDPDASLQPPFNIPEGDLSLTPPTSANEDWVLWVSDGSNLNTGVTHASPGNSMLSINFSGVDFNIGQVFLPVICSPKSR